MPKPTPVNDHDQGRFAGSLFAATVVMTVGLGVCLVIVFLFAPDAWWPLVLIGGGVVGLMLLVWLFTDPPLRRARDSNLYGVRRELVDELRRIVSSAPPPPARRPTSARTSRRPPTTCGRSKKTRTPGTPPIGEWKSTAAISKEG